jgi:hypothetical protein
MEAVLQSKGFLSLPTNPKNKFLNPSNGLKHRFFSPNPKILGGFSLNPNGLHKLNSSTLKASIFDKKDKNLFICKLKQLLLMVVVVMGKQFLRNQKLRKKNFWVLKLQHSRKLYLLE